RSQVVRNRCGFKVGFGAFAAVLTQKSAHICQLSRFTVVLCYPPLPSYAPPSPLSSPLIEGTSAHWWCCGVLTTAELVVKGSFNQVPDLVTNRLHEEHCCGWCAMYPVTRARMLRQTPDHQVLAFSSTQDLTRCAAGRKSREKSPDASNRSERPAFFASNIERIWRSAKAPGNPGSLRACSISSGETAQTQSNPGQLCSLNADFVQLYQVHTSLLTDFYCDLVVRVISETRAWDTSGGVVALGVAARLRGPELGTFDEIELQPAEQSTSATIAAPKPSAVANAAEYRISHHREPGWTKTIPKAIGRAMRTAVRTPSRDAEMSGLRSEVDVMKALSLGPRGLCLPQQGSTPAAPSRLSN
ncbi:hypothetical protein HII31_02375, partial [Pseudocercospora fuligena]